MSNVDDDDDSDDMTTNPSVANTNIQHIRILSDYDPSCNDFAGEIVFRREVFCWNPHLPGVRTAVYDQLQGVHGNLF